MERGVDSMDILDKIMDFAEEHPYFTVLGIMGCAVGFLIDLNMKGEK